MLPAFSIQSNLLVNTLLFYLAIVVCFSLRIFGHPEGSKGELGDEDMSAVKVSILAQVFYQTSHQSQTFNFGLLIT